MMTSICVWATTNLRMSAYNMNERSWDKLPQPPTFLADEAFLIPSGCKLHSQTFCKLTYGHWSSLKLNEAKTECYNNM